VNGHWLEVECPDPAVAILQLEDLLIKYGTVGVKEASITYRSGNMFEREKDAE